MLQDLYSLMRFLRHEPWGELSWWQRIIAVPYEAGDARAIPTLQVSQLERIRLCCILLPWL